MQDSPGRRGLPRHAADERRVGALIRDMTLEEKIGQLTQVQGGEGAIPDWLHDSVAGGRTGSVLNEVDVGIANELQRIARQESRLGIPLLIARDVIHGFRTVFPIPLAQAASWNPEGVEEAARVAATEAAAAGINWIFAPMLDITRDPRWGRIAECLGEDPCLASALGAAMVRGLQDGAPNPRRRVAACAKHLAGYGAAEAGRDYAAASIPEGELRDVYLPPFRAAIEAGVASVMTSFSDLNGVPATANPFLLRQVLREEWEFDGVVVSDWNAITELAVHGLTEGDRQSAREAINAGVDIEMASGAYAGHLPDLLRSGEVSEAHIDEAVANVLRLKQRLGLFEDAFTPPGGVPTSTAEEHRRVARRSALESAVLLKNEGEVLPLRADTLRSVAVIGYLADDPYEQLGTWIFDGDPDLSVTLLEALRERLEPAVVVDYARGMETTRSRGRKYVDEAVAAARRSDVVLLVVGEESILSGEGHCRADIGLPGSQAELVAEVAATGRPLVLLVMAGRPLALGDVAERADAILYLWHPGTMGGAAVADLLTGVESPSGKLPVSFPRMTGQIPIYYSRRNTGRPATAGMPVPVEEIPPRAPQTSVGNRSFHLDAGDTPLWPFGYGLSYARFEYGDLRLAPDTISAGDALEVSANVTNAGEVEAVEVVQLYVRDLVASVTRPVRELKDFRRVRLAPGETRRVGFRLAGAQLAFHGLDMRPVIEPGRFRVWIGGSSAADLGAEFELTA
ncbi:MAG: glycoside hydrolase family 3 N-terminal domain-containing protein [Gammaproteobacteria bacterium]